MVDVSLKELLEAGCHFGHQVTRWHPKAQRYIYTSRDNIHIIDLAQTKKGLLSACEFITKTVANGGTVIFVGTKRQAQGVVREEAERVGALFITTRWPGGLLTNWEVMYKNLVKVRNLAERIRNEEERKKYKKKELAGWDKEYAKLMHLYGGIVNLTKIPEAVFIVDTHKEDGAVREAIKMGVFVVGITDTNTNPELIDYPIPANDDAVGSIKLIVSKLAQAYEEGKEKVGEKEEEEEKEVVLKKEKKIKEKKMKKVEKAAKARKVSKTKARKEVS
jgi:small subunit ribosomal protein S2